jgi:hypothetical protein
MAVSSSTTVSCPPLYFASSTRPSSGKPQQSALLLS